MKRLFYIILALLINTTVYAKVGDRYFCEDTKGDLKVKSKYTLFWSPDGYIHGKYFKNEGNARVETRDKIIFQNDNSFISFDPNYKNGVTTTSFFESGNDIVSIRTFIEKGYTFSQKSKCFRQ